MPNDAPGRTTHNQQIVAQASLELGRKVTIREAAAYVRAQKAGALPVPLDPLPSVENSRGRCSQRSTPCTISATESTRSST